MKTRLVFLFTITVILFGCKENGEKRTNQSDEKTSEAIGLEGDSIALKSEEINPTSSKPIPELLSFVREIEKSDWIPDTLRLRKKRLYPYLGEKVHFNNYPFYKIDFKKTDLKRAYNHDSGFLKSNSNKPDIELFGKAIGIWGYFYRDKNAQNSITDGVIEQWEFANEKDAQKALSQIQAVGHYVYFNTRPFHCIIGNYLIIFRTRAMSYSYIQEKLFEEFRKNTFDN